MIFFTEQAKLGLQNKIKESITFHTQRLFLSNSRSRRCFGIREVAVIKMLEENGIRSEN